MTALLSFSLKLFLQVQSPPPEKKGSPFLEGRSSFGECALPGGLNGRSSHTASGWLPSGVPTVSGTGGGSGDLEAEAERPGSRLKPAQGCRGWSSPGFHVAILGIL